MPRINLARVIGLRVETVLNCPEKLIPVDPALPADAREAAILDYMSTDAHLDPLANEIVGVSLSADPGMPGPGMSMFKGRAWPMAGQGETVAMEEKHILLATWSYLDWLMAQDQTGMPMFCAPMIVQKHWRFLLVRSVFCGVSVPWWAHKGLSVNKPWNNSEILACPLDAFCFGGKGGRNLTFPRLAEFLKLPIPATSVRDHMSGLMTDPIPDKVIAESMEWAVAYRRAIVQIESFLS